MKPFNLFLFLLWLNIKIIYKEMKTKIKAFWVRARAALGMLVIIITAFVVLSCTRHKAAEGSANSKIWADYTLVKVLSGIKNDTPVTRYERYQYRILLPDSTITVKFTNKFYMPGDRIKLND